MPKLIEFPKNKKAFEIKNKGEDKAEILLYGAIGVSFWEDSITAKQFSEELKKLPSSVKNIDLRINSGGGDVFEGYAIANRIKQHSAKVTAYVDGLAASIASIIAISADEIVMGETSQMMIHKAWTFAAGNSKDMEAVVDRLEEIDEQLASMYMKKTGKSRSEIKEMMAKETWMTADEAVEMGFADSKFDSEFSIAASVFDKATWISKPPKNLKTRDIEVKNKLSEFLARNKK